MEADEGPMVLLQISYNIKYKEQKSFKLESSAYKYREMDSVGVR